MPRAEVSTAACLSQRGAGQVVSVKTKDGHQDKLSLETTPYKEGELFKEGGPLEAQMLLLALDRYPYLASTEKILGTQFPALKLKSELR